MLIEDTKRKHPEEMERLWAADDLDMAKFRKQWTNLFDPVWPPGLTHATCFKYQQKYEVELPLVFFAQLCQIKRDNTDLSMSSFRDRTGKLRKGVVVDYILEALKGYPAVVFVLGDAYQARLRNTIGHNEYSLVGNEIRSLDGRTVVRADEFFRALLALQEVQNAVIWLFHRQSHPSIELARFGILSIGFMRDQVQGLPAMHIFQLEPFRRLDERASWLTEIQFEVLNSALATTLGSAPIQQGSLNEDLCSWLTRANNVGRIHCELIAAMPCFHTEKHFIQTPWGEFCQRGSATSLVVPAKVTGL
jgi:hypothetical protein